MLEVQLNDGTIDMVFERFFFGKGGAGEQCFLIDGQLGQQIPNLLPLTADDRMEQQIPNALLIFHLGQRPNIRRGIGTEGDDFFSGGEDR